MTSAIPVSLPWDSEFFGARIGSVEVESERELAAAARRARALEIECLYLFVPGHRLETIAAAIRAGGRLVDVRTTLDLTVDGAVPPGSCRLATTDDLELLLPLVERLAPTSRFSGDPSFAGDRIVEMYRLWLRLCLADGVVAVADDRRGLVGVRCSGRVANVELVYLDPDTRGHGLARELVFSAVAATGAESAILRTQTGNVAALRSFQSFGFRTSSVCAILHLWL
jgi:GNAT superfamily N-acetyltransferase